MNPKTTLFCLLLELLFVSSYPSQASDTAYQSHQSIIDAVKDYLITDLGQNNNQLTIKITPLDHRLKLAQCDRPLETFSPPGGTKLGRTSVGVKCLAPAPWTLYVSANVGIETSVVVSDRDLARGQAITARDLKIKVADTNHLLRGYFESTDEVVGKTAKRTLRRGQVITPSMLVVRKTIKRGDQVTILAGTDSIQVCMQGKAMKQGNPGDLITVMNNKSKKKVEARVVSKGLVMVD